MTNDFRLVIAYGPGVDVHPRDFVASVNAFLDGRSYVSCVVRDFHAQAVEDDPGPFSARCYGVVLGTLLQRKTVVVTDSVFDDDRRRRFVEGAYRVVLPDLLVEHLYLDAAPAVSPILAAHPGIAIDDDVYGQGPHASHESIRVTADAPRDALVAALTAAGDRMMSVGDDGREYGDVDEADEAGVYTPNWVSDVTVDAGGEAGLYIDCKGGIEPEMAVKFREVLVEELVRAGIEKAHVRVRE